MEASRYLDTQRPSTTHDQLENVVIEQPEETETPGAVCSMNDYSWDSQGSQIGVSCDKLHKLNYHRIISSHLQQHHDQATSIKSIKRITLVNSDSRVILPAIDLICNLSDCTRLHLLNLSNNRFMHENHDISRLITNWTQLETLDLSNTSLTSVEPIITRATTQGSKVSLARLYTLRLDNNYLTRLDFEWITGRFPNLRSLSLRNNNITSIVLNDQNLLKIMNDYDCLSLAGNQINCDKSQLKFLKLLQDPMYSQKFPDIDQIGCNNPTVLIDMSWPQRLSVLETPICDTCECRSSKRTSITIDCYARNLTSLPNILPVNTKVLNLTSNQIENLELGPNAKNWENVTYLHLDDNLITSIDGLEGEFNVMKNLAKLDLRKNKLQLFNTKILAGSSRIDSIHISDNPWRCRCLYTKDFAEWIRRNFQRIADEEDVKCGILGTDANGIKSFDRGEQPLAGRIIYRILPDDLCPVSLFLDPFEVMDALNIFLVSTMLLAIMKTIMDCIYQKRTKRLPLFYKLNFW